MLKIRLSRKGKKNSPFYKIVVIESHRKRDGKYVDSLGHFDPSNNELELDKDRYEDWIKKGAQVTEAVKKLIKK